MATIERQLQQNLNKIENWATSNGFKFSKSKTQCVHFCQLRKQHDDLVLHLYGSPIPVVQYLMTWFLIAVRQEVKRIDNSVVVHALELAIKRDL